MPSPVVAHLDQRTPSALPLRLAATMPPGGV